MLIAGGPISTFKELTEAARRQRESLEQRYRQLTPREREVMDDVVRGIPNRRVAERLGVSERTVELHRARVMAKMEADSLAALVHMAYRCRAGRSGEGLSNDNLSLVMHSSTWISASIPSPPGKEPSRPTRGDNTTFQEVHIL